MEEVLISTYSVCFKHRQLPWLSPDLFFIINDRIICMCLYLHIVIWDSLVIFHWYFLFIKFIFPILRSLSYLFLKFILGEFHTSMFYCSLSNHATSPQSSPSPYPHNFMIFLFNNNNKKRNPISIGLLCLSIACLPWSVADDAPHLLVRGGTLWSLSPSLCWDFVSLNLCASCTGCSHLWLHMCISPTVSEKCYFLEAMSFFPRCCQRPLSFQGEGCDKDIPVRSECSKISPLCLLPQCGVRLCVTLFSAARSFSTEGWAMHWFAWDPRLLANEVRKVSRKRFSSPTPI